MIFGSCSFNCSLCKLHSAGVCVPAMLSLVQDEMLGSVKDSGGAEWSVLVMDDVTTRVMSHSCRISDVLDFGVSCELSSPFSCFAPSSSFLGDLHHNETRTGTGHEAWHGPVAYYAHSHSYRPRISQGLLITANADRRAWKEPFPQVRFLALGSCPASHACLLSAASLASLSPNIR